MNYKQQLAMIGSGLTSFLFLTGFVKSAVYKGTPPASLTLIV